MPPPSEQALPAASGAPPALRPSPPLGHCLALSLGWASLGSFPQLNALEMEDQSRGEARSCSLSRPRPSWPRSVGPVAPQLPRLVPPTFSPASPMDPGAQALPSVPTGQGPSPLLAGWPGATQVCLGRPLPSLCQVAVAHLQTW